MLLDLLSQKTNVFGQIIHIGHWHIYKYGLGAKISDIPLYIIDFRSKLPIIYDCEGVVFDSISDIKKSIAAAKSIQERLELGWRPNKISYTIGQLYNELNKIADEEDLL